MEEQPRKIKTYPDLNSASITLRKYKQLRLWYLLQDLDEQGGGRLMKKETQKALKDIMSYEVFRTTLLSGEGTFWEVKTRREVLGGGELIELYGLWRIALELGVYKLRKSPALVPLEAFKNIHEFKVFIYATWFNNEKSNPISRRTLKKLAGISAPTQVKYDKRAEVQITKNVSVIGPKSGIVPSDMSAMGYYVTEVKGQLQLCKRMPNSYFCYFQSAPRGRMRKANYRLTARGYAARDDVIERRYFESPMGWLKSRKTRADFSYIQAGNFGTTQLWEEMYLDPSF